MQKYTPPTHTLDGKDLFTATYGAHLQALKCMRLGTILDFIIRMKTEGRTMINHALWGSVIQATTNFQECASMVPRVGVLGGILIRAPASILIQPIQMNHGVVDL